MSLQHERILELCDRLSLTAMAAQYNGADFTNVG